MVDRDGSPPGAREVFNGFTQLSVDEALERHTFVPDSLGLTKWRVHCMELGVFEYPTEEFVDAMGGYLAGRITEIRGRLAPDEPVRLLEVAAGNGLLSALLDQNLKTKLSDEDFELLATDDGSFVRPYERFGVKQQDYADAVDEFRPQIIIGAWLPFDETDWTASFRQESTQEYILIGKASGNERHAQPEAWGETYVDSIPTPEPVPGYAQDGFQRIDLPEMQPLQLCFISTTHDPHPSETIVFRRISPGTTEVI